MDVEAAMAAIGGVGPPQQKLRSQPALGKSSDVGAIAVGDIRRKVAVLPVGGYPLKPPKILIYGQNGYTTLGVGLLGGGGSKGVSDGHRGV